LNVALKRNTVAAWITVDGSPLRGCQVCDFGQDLIEETRGDTCCHPSVGRAVPTGKARRFGGACGIEAKFLTIKGVQL
jgi:hypothetical protein